MLNTALAEGLQSYTQTAEGVGFVPSILLRTSDTPHRWRPNSNYTLPPGSNAMLNYTCRQNVNTILLTDLSEKKFFSASMFS